MTTHPHTRTERQLDCRVCSPCTRAGAPAHRHHERGIGMVEILVVLVIIMLIGGIAFASLSSTQRNSAVNEARATARVLGEAVEQFQRDHGGRLPVQPGLTAAGSPQSDWTANWTSPVDAGNRHGSTPKPYASNAAVEALIDRVVVLERTNGTVRTGTGNVALRIRYYADVNRGLYALMVRSRTGSAWKSHCYVTNADRETTAGATFLAPLVSSIGGGRTC